MTGIVVLLAGLALIVSGVVLFVVERLRPGKVAAWLKSKFGKAKDGS